MSANFDNDGRVKQLDGAIAPDEVLTEQDVGEPMKLATKVEAGRWYTSSGVPNCSITPAFITIMRWASVMAST